ncbi:MAG: aldo/keto reductase [Anaerolineales bacterium]|nr:aldo/keto reductase [Anaerolineales bacterium]
MQYRTFGKLDWKPSALGFGCMRLPTTDGDAANIDQEKTTEMIRTAVDAGVNYFDTAYPYHKEKSEAALGIALQDGYRERVCIATKSPVWKVHESSDFDRLLDIQLERLQTGTIDFYLLHALNAESWEKVQRLDLLRRAEAALADGRIRHLGFSFHDNLNTFKQIIDGYDGWEFCQIQYNYMDITFQAGTEGLRYAAGKGLGVIIMEPLLGGKLALDLPATRPLWDTAEQKRTPVDWALQWIWSQPEVSLVLSGMSTLEQVQQNIESASVSRPGLLSDGNLVMIDKARDMVNDLGPIPCTRCEYCLPCPNGVNIPRNFDVYNKAAMFDNLEGSRHEYVRWIPDEEKAAACIECDECLPKCPQQIPISTWLPVVADVLGENKPYVKSL